ncbi:BBP7 family outer membrane beta-barrel protein [Allorhodopirellula solitaria]|nr:BBP7 family outer membrane beta-barrel protein [Allorhodopirellula solitaria]
MNTKWKMLTLAAMLSAGTTAATAADNGYISEYGEDAYFAETSEYIGGLYEDGANGNAAGTVSESDYVDEADSALNTVEPVAFVGDSQPSYEHEVYPQHEGYPQDFGSGVVMDTGSYAYASGQGGCSDGSCGPTYAESCRPARSMACETGHWLTLEALLWFPQVRSSVPLVSTSAAGTLPELDQGASVAYGGNDAFGGNLQAGFRVDGGFMLSDDFGVGGRFWMLGQDSDSFSQGGDGTNGSIGIPFYDTDLSTGAENAIRIAYADGIGAGDSDFTGSVSAKSSFSVYAAEAYGRLRLLGGNGYRSDFIGGFSHFNIEDDLSLSATTTQVEVGPGQGNRFSYFDSYTASNEFYGGQIGFLTTVGRGAWTLSALTKVHLGNMDQTLTNASSRTLPAPAGVQEGGIFSPSDQASISRDSFTFAPEANLKLAYRVRENIRFSVGYTFLMWNDVLMAGDNLNRSINSSYLVGDGAGVVQPPQRPAFQGLETDSLFVHGVDLGCVIQF